MNKFNKLWGGSGGEYHTDPFHSDYDYTRKQILMKDLSQRYLYVINV